LLLELVESIGAFFVERGVLELRLAGDECGGDAATDDDGAEHGGEEWPDR
jgi:hypothetical protein